MHPHQLGLTALCELLFKVVGAYNYRAFEMMNLIFALGSVYLGYRILSEMTRSTAAIVGYNILMFGCLPLILYTPWVYGDVPSIFFALLAEWMLLRYLAEKKKRHLARGTKEYCWLSCWRWFSRMVPMSLSIKYMKSVPAMSRAEVSPLSHG